MWLTYPINGNMNAGNLFSATIIKYNQCINLTRLFLATIPKIAHIRILVKGFGVGAFLFFKSVL